MASPASDTSKLAPESWICKPCGICCGNSHSQGSNTTAANAGVSKGPRNMRQGRSDKATTSEISASTASIDVNNIGPIEISVGKTPSQPQTWSPCAAQPARASTHAGSLGMPFMPPIFFIIFIRPPPFIFFIMPCICSNSLSRRLTS